MTTPHNTAQKCENCGRETEHGSPFFAEPTGALDVMHGAQGRWWCIWCQAYRCEEYAAEVAANAAKVRARATSCEGSRGAE